MPSRRYALATAVPGAADHMLIPAPPRAVRPARSRVVPRTLPLALAALAATLLLLGAVEIALLEAGPASPTWAVLLFRSSAGSTPPPGCSRGGAGRATAPAR